MKNHFNKEEAEFAKVLNSIVMGDRFEDKDTDDYIYASLSQPPLKVMDKHNSTNEFDWDVKCPTCGAIINYGKEIFMLSGHHYCIHDGCREKLCHLLGKDY